MEKVANFRVKLSSSAMALTLSPLVSQRAVSQSPVFQFKEGGTFGSGVTIRRRSVKLELRLPFKIFAKAHNGVDGASRRCDGNLQGSTQQRLKFICRGGSSTTKRLVLSFQFIYTSPPW